MSDERRDRSSAGGAEEALARELVELGPLMLDQERTEAMLPDIAFARGLRDRLVTPDTLAPHPAFARGLRDHLTGVDRLRPSRPVSDMRQALRGARAMLAAALIAVVLGAVLVLHPSPERRPAPVTWVPPAPGLADLTRGFPAPPGGGGGGRLSPEQSFLDPSPNPPYGGRLRLSAGTLPAGAASLPAYRLREPSLGLPGMRSLARRLDIHAPVRRTASGSAIWLVAADESPSGVHSLAVSTATGELVYHDSTTHVPRAGRPPVGGDAVRVGVLARAWVMGLGWPGKEMPLQAARHEPVTGPGIWVVRLGWAGVGPTTTTAATVWLDPVGRVLEARLWPPVAASRAVPATGVPRAWAALRRGDVPVAVEGPAAATAADGQGTVRRVEVVHVLSADAVGALYLVPAYRFSGAAQLALPQGKGPSSTMTPTAATWYAVAPAAR